MRFSARARVTMAAGLSASCLFLVLGIRELARPADAAKPVKPAPPVMAVPLAAAARPIAVGETIGARLIRTRIGAPTGNAAVATPAEVIGKVATRPIPAGHLIERTMIDGQDRLAIRVPLGMRAMSIDTTAEIAAAGLIRPGDRVDVQVIYPGEDALAAASGQGRSRTEALLQMVPVLAVGDRVLGGKAPADDAPSAGRMAAAARTVTLALTPEQVSTLALARNVGALYLSLRNPGDEETGPATAPLVPRPTAAGASTPRVQPTRTRAPRHAIHLVVGGRSRILHAEGRR